MPVSESSCVARVSHEAGSELSPPLPPLAGHQQAAGQAAALQARTLEGHAGACRG